MTQVKICCISSIEEAQLAIGLGANAIGLVSEMPSGPGVISEQGIKEIINQLTEPIQSFLLSSKSNAEDFAKQIVYTGANTLQIVDYIETPVYELLRDLLPGITLVQVIHVLSEQDISRALSLENHIDMVLLDSGNPNAATKSLGGTGSTHDWEISRQIVDELSIPVFLAGGLNHKNVAEAIETVKPYGVDLCSGVRRDGKLDPELLSLFMAEIPQ